MKEIKNKNKEFSYFPRKFNRGANNLHLKCYDKQINKTKYIII